MIVGPNHFFTFDGLIYSYSGQCVHLLTADLVDGNFSVSLQYESEEKATKDSVPYTIIVSSSHNTLVIDLPENVNQRTKWHVKLLTVAT